MTKISLCMIVIFFIIVVSQGSRYRTNNKFNKYWKPKRIYNKYWKPKRIYNKYWKPKRIYNKYWTPKVIKPYQPAQDYYKEGDTVNIVCKVKEVIRVSYANLKGGRKHCRTCNPMQHVKNGCNGKQTCGFKVNLDFFGKSCSLTNAKLVLKYKCIPDPCSSFCCANGGVCKLTDPKGDNFDPTCMCIHGWEGKNCLDCDLNGTKYPCNWRNRTFDVFSNDTDVFISVAADGRSYFSVTNNATVEIVATLGSFIIMRSDLLGFTCAKVDSKQSGRDRFVYRLSGPSNSSDPCVVCNANGFFGTYVLEAIAIDSDIKPGGFINDTFCDTPMGCNTTTGVVCIDNGSLDFNEGCP